ncbi:MAG TPA: hypothetical protein ENN55_04340 [Firmicutes bacterium]|nr:hypothetical protein [Bacillota bacterium]
MARPRKEEREENKIDRQIVNLEVDLFVLKPTEFLILPETPNIYLSNEKAKRFLSELQEAIRVAKDGVIIRLQGEVNPREDKSEGDGSMFLSREMKVGELEMGN